MVRLVGNLQHMRLQSESDHDHDHKSNSNQHVRSTHVWERDISHTGARFSETRQRGQVTRGGGGSGVYVWGGVHGHSR